MKNFFIFSFVTISYIAGQGVVDFIEIKWQKESCCLEVIQGTQDKKEFFVLLEGQRDTANLVMRSDTILKIDTALFKEAVVVLE